MQVPAWIISVDVTVTSVSQLSEAVAGTTGGMASHSAVISAGTLVKVGGVVSSMVITWVA